MAAKINLRPAELAEFAEQFLAVLHVGVIRLVRAEETPDRRQLRDRPGGVHRDRSRELGMPAPAAGKAAASDNKSTALIIKRRPEKTHRIGAVKRIPWTGAHVNLDPVGCPIRLSSQTKSRSPGAAPGHIPPRRSKARVSSPHCGENHSGWRTGPVSFRAEIYCRRHCQPTMTTYRLPLRSWCLKSGRSFPAKRALLPRIGV